MTGKTKSKGARGWACSQVPGRVNCGMMTREKMQSKVPACSRKIRLVFNI